MTPAFRVGVVAALALPLIAQTEPAKPPVDALGRSTPRGAIIGFLQAAQRDRLRLASEYLQLSEGDRNARGERLAGQLSSVLDHGFHGSLDAVSNRPEGALDDNLPVDLEEIAIQIPGAVSAPLRLVRVNGGDAGMIWLIAQQSVARIPDLYGLIAFPKIENLLPDFLVHHRLLGMPLWQWLAALLMAPVALGFGWVFARLLMSPIRAALRRIRGTAGGSDLWWRNSVGAPLAALLAMGAHALFVDTLGVPLLYRHYYLRIVLVSMLLAMGWLLWRLVDHGFRRGVDHARAAGRGSAASLMLLGRRILKALLVVLIGVAILAALGFQTTGILTGLGIGGIAVALAAQKTIENLFGGVSLVSDEVFRVGDTVKLGDRVGSVEDIGLRSTRIRTKERSELSVPNGSLAAMNIENLSRRDKILMEKTIWIRVETPPAAIRALIAHGREFIDAHPMLTHPDSRVRLASVEETGFKVEIFAFVETTNFVEYLAVQEEILLRLAEFAEAEGVPLSSRHSRPGAPDVAPPEAGAE
ncbi:MAG: mechanosensitive ion channel family protein [Bryobacteraceae bacterium]